MCIKESRYHSLCNGRLDAAPVHDLVLLPVANIKKGEDLVNKMPHRNDDDAADDDDYDDCDD